MGSTSLSVAEAGNLKLDLMAKKHWNSLFWFEYIFSVFFNLVSSRFYVVLLFKC